MARLVGLPNGRVSADGSPGRTDDGRADDFKLDATAREVQSRKAVPRAVFWFERGGFLVLTGMPRPVLGESCTTSIKDFAIFPPHQKKKNSLTQLLKKYIPFNWTEKQQAASDILKAKLCQQRPNFSQPFILTTDTSGFAIGGILSQRKIGKAKPIAYFSRSLSDTEKKYDTYEKEALVIIFCLTYFRPYLYKRKFTLVTDNKPLVWIQNSKDPC